MSDDTPRPPQAAPPDPAAIHHLEGFGLDPADDEGVDATLATLEMAGEEMAAGWAPRPHRPLAPEVRYLHISRTIHQLVTDRNRSVGIVLFVASLLIGSSTALLNVQSGAIPRPVLEPLQRWCLPSAFAALAILGVFMCLILIRTRIGLIYEVAKMNALLGLPSERVRRVNPLSIFFLMHLLVATLGGASAGLAIGLAAAIVAGTRPEGGGTVIQVRNPDFGDGNGLAPATIALAAGIAVAYILTFQLAYYWTILSATTDDKLRVAQG